MEENKTEDFYGSNSNQGIENIQEEHEFSFADSLPEYSGEKVYSMDEIYVGNLSLEANDHDIRKIFRNFGDIKLIRTSKTKKGKKKYAYICFNHDATSALSANGHLLHGCKLVVERYLR